MFIDFDEYPRYSGRESMIFEKDVNEAIKCNNIPFANGLMRKLGIE